MSCEALEKKRLQKLQYSRTPEVLITEELICTDVRYFFGFLTLGRVQYKKKWTDIKEQWNLYFKNLSLNKTKFVKFVGKEEQFFFFCNSKLICFYKTIKVSLYWWYKDTIQ